MTFALPRPPVPAVFATRGGLGFTMPPSSPPLKKVFGDYCFRATCQIIDDVRGCPVGKVKGYDRTPEVGRDTEYVCGLHLRGMPPGAFSCGEAEVVMLPATPTDMECSGQMFFVMDGEVKKLV